MKKSVGEKCMCMIRSVLIVLAAAAVSLSLSGWQSAVKHQSAKELSEGYYWFEAVFLDYEEAADMFRSISENYPDYEVLTHSFHVTTEFKPEKRHESLYGTPVSVHITGYASGPVRDEDGHILSYNEGVLVEITSENKELQELFDRLDKTWHITGSYTEGAKYTEQLDFSNAKPVDITMEGIFGMADSDRKFTLE